MISCLPERNAASQVACSGMITRRNSSIRTTVSRTIPIVSNQGPRPVFSATVSASIDSPGDYVISLNANSSSDPDGTIASYLWEVKDSSGEGVIYNNTSPLQTHTITAGNEGMYKVYLAVQDNRESYKEAEATIYVGVTVPSGGSAPSIIESASSTLGTAPLTVNFDASFSFDIDGDTFTAHWFFDDRSNPKSVIDGLTATYTFQIRVHIFHELY